MALSKRNTSLIQGNLQSIVLKLLQDKGKMYAYEIIQTAKKMTNGKIEITEGALYPLLHRLEENKTLEVEIRSIGNRSRKYYKLTKKGILETKEQLSELQEFMEIMQVFFNSKIKPI